MPSSFPYRQFRIHWQAAFENSLDERFNVRKFISLADRVGLNVPRDSFNSIWNLPFPFPDLASISVSSGQDLIDVDPDEFTSIGYALARHHRVPTRLMDFTMRPSVAAFFAAYTDKSDDKDDETRKIVIWAILAKCMHKDIRIVNHRRGEIGFLQAQEGLFLLDRLTVEKFWFTGNWIPFEYYFKDMIEEETAYKFSLPFNQRGRLLKLLAMKGITMSSLMPTFDNVWRDLNRNPDIFRNLGWE